MKTLLVHNKGDVDIVIATRGGKYAKTISDPGWHLVAPWRKVVGRTIKAPVFAQHAVGASTRDAAKVLVSVAVDFTIKDAAKFHYAAPSPCNSALTEIGAAARDVVSNMGLADIWERRNDIEMKACAAIAPHLAEKFGVELHDVRVQEISLSSYCLSSPSPALNKILENAKEGPARVAAEMDKGLENTIRVTKPLLLRKPAV